MKKGLSGLLVLSVSCLTLIIIIALSLTYLSAGNGLTVSGDYEQTGNTADSAAEQEETEESITETGGINSDTENNINTDNTAYTDTTATDISQSAIDVSEQAVAVTEDELEEEPSVADATPEPDMDPDTWDYIRGGDYNMVYKDKEIPKVMPYEIHVNKLMNCVTIYKANKKGKYTKPVKAIVCSAGSATPVGTFKTSDKYYWKAMIHGVWAQYATRITGKFLFHSVPYDDHEKNTLITSYYNRLGSTASAGCVRMSVKDAKWIIENCPAGTTVVVYNDYDPGPLGKPTPKRIPYNCTWDPTDPDIRNPWKGDKSTISGVKNRTIERCPGINLLNGITAYDVHSGAISTDKIKIKGKVNCAVPGEYKVKYTFKDSKKKKITKKCRFTVVDTKGPVISGLPATINVKDASTVSTDYIMNKAVLTDNGFSLSKQEHMSISHSDNTYVINAHDDYGHYTSYTVKVVEDNEAPVIKLKADSKTEYPVTKKIDAAWAAGRIKKVSDNKTKLAKSDVKISVKPSGWGMKITYSVKDASGNKTVTSEKIAYETASLSLTSDNITIDSIKNTAALSKYVKLTSDSTGKKIPCSIKIKHKKTGSDDINKIYKVTFTATYKSSAGKKHTSATATVYTKK